MPLTYHFWFVCTLHMLDCFTCKVKYQLWKEICLNNNPNGKNDHSASSPPPPQISCFLLLLGSMSGLHNGIAVPYLQQICVCTSDNAVHLQFASIAKLE